MEFDDIQKRFKKLSDELEKIDQVINAESKEPDAPEKIIEKLGGGVEKPEIEGPTPLGETREEAVAEDEEKVLTRVEKVNKLIEKKMEEIISG